MKKNKLLIFLAAAAPILLVALCYRHLPDTVPTSWRLDGEVVYSRKSALWLISGLSPFLATSCLKSKATSFSASALPGPSLIRRFGTKRTVWPARFSLSAAC